MQEPHFQHFIVVLFLDFLMMWIQVCWESEPSFMITAIPIQVSDIKCFLF